jgi:hypothetical protein
VLFGRLTLDRTISDFLEKESALVHMRDDTGFDLQRAPTEDPIDTFFDHNKPLVVKLDVDQRGCEFLLRGYGTPAVNATKITARAELKFMSVANERHEELEGIDISPGNKFSIEPVVMETISAKVFRGSSPRSYNCDATKISKSGAFGWNAVDLVVKTKATDKIAKSLKWLDDSGALVKSFQPTAVTKGSHFLLSDVNTKRVNITLDYYDSNEKVESQIELEVGLGL